MANRTREIIRGELNDLLAQAREYHDLFATPGWRRLREWHRQQRVASQDGLADLVLQGKQQEAHATAAIIKASLEMEEREETIMEELKERGQLLERELGT